MLEWVFWIVYLATPLVMVLLLKVAGVQINRISLIGVVVLAIYAFSVIGTLPLFYQWDTYRAEVGVVDQSLIFLVLLYSSINLIFLLLGIILTRRVIGLMPKRSYGVVGPLMRKNVLALFMLLGVSIATLFLYIQQLETVALFVALNSGVADASVSRSLMGNDFHGKYHWYQVFMYELSQFIAYIFFANWLVLKTKRSCLYFWISFSVASFIAVMATEKGPMAWFLVGLFLTYLLVVKNGVIPMRATLWFLLIVVGALMLMYIFFMGSIDLVDAFSSVFSRTFTGGIMPAYFYLEYFPDVNDYLMGSTFPNPGGIFPFTSVRYTVDVMNWVFPGLDSSGVVGSMPTVFWGEAYANFGPLGIPIVAITVGVFLVIIDWVINKFEWNSMGISLLVWASLHYKDLSSTGFSGFFVDLKFFIIFFAYFFAMMIVVIVKSSPRTNKFSL